MMSVAFAALRQTITDRKGVTAMEYAILGAAIIVAVGAAMAKFQPLLEAKFAALLPS